MKQLNSLWNFFASIKLAIFTLFTIAITSIIGTIIPQHESFSFYAARYGAGLAHFFHVLDIQDMYGSWWFLGLLGLLSTNLIICSADRFPAVWKQITADQSAVSNNKLERMPYTHTFFSSKKSTETTQAIQAALTSNGWRAKATNKANANLLSAQKGVWTRTGVYIVHASILIIFAGAVVGHFFGFKGNVMIPETKKTDKIYAASTSVPIELGFEVQCDAFELEFYDNGMPKEYRSRLTVLENDKTILVKDIEVNTPLKYRGITFYQSSYEGYQDFIITISTPDGQLSQTFVAPFQQQIDWPETSIRFGIVNAEAIRDRVVRMKVWFKDGENPPAVFWLDANTQAPIENNKHGYLISAKQMYATGLQVAKDPGVWLVYFGCGLMMLGLYLAFFMSHQRIWVYIAKSPSGSTLLFAGTTNKNKIGFDKTFSNLKTALTDTVKTEKASHYYPE